MSESNLQAATMANYLSVVRKPTGINPVTYDEYDTILQTDLQFNITGWNVFSRELHGHELVAGRNLFELMDIHFTEGNFENFQEHLLVNGFWKGEMTMLDAEGELVYYRTTAACIVDAEGQPVSVLLAGENITSMRKREAALAAEEKKYAVLLDALPEGFMIVNRTGAVETCNKAGAEMLGFREDELTGKQLKDLLHAVKREDGTLLEPELFPAMHTLRTAEPQQQVIIEWQLPGRDPVWLSMHAEALIHEGDLRPYAVAIYYADITKQKKAGEELTRTRELVDAFARISLDGDASWEFDPTTNTINRSEALMRLSGYTAAEAKPDMNWWMSKIHPDDRERVKISMQQAIEKQAERWEDHYWFECADGTYKFFRDSAVLLVKDGRPVREFGSVKDLTEIKKLEARLEAEQNLRRKAIAVATVQGQEAEKTNISRELHDNVNQLLMSAKLFMEMAVKRPAETAEMIDRAIEYQMMAIQEIRQLSHTMNAAHIKRFRLKKSVSNIVDNLRLVRGLKVKFSCGRQVENKLTDEQKLMIFRVIQEQTNNIIKYAEGAKSVQIKISEVSDIIHLLVIDDGKGFDVTRHDHSGIGFINIRSRAEAHDGEVNIISAPDRGCTLELLFPLRKNGMSEVTD